MDQKSSNDNVCPHCGGAGVLFSDRNGLVFSRPCVCALRERQERIWRRSGFANCNLDVPMGRTARAYAEQFDAIRRSRNNWIMFAGKTGSGKTTQAALIARTLIKNNEPVVSRMISYFDLLRKMSGLWGSYRQEDISREIDQIVDVDLIIIDDFLKGAKKNYGNDFSATCSLFDHFYRLRKPVVITTEYYKEEIAKFDPATAGRIIEMCDGRIVEFGQDAINHRLS